MASEAAALSRVICDIYDAAVDATLWPKAMQSSCEFIGAAQSLMFWHDAVIEAANAMYEYRMDPHFTRLYIEKYVTLNPIFPAALFSDVSAVGRVHSATDIVPQVELEETRFFKEWVVPQGITDTLAVTLEKDMLRGAFYAIHWCGGLVDDGARTRFALLVPHLQRAVAIGRLFVRQESMEKGFTNTLNRLDAAVFLLAGKGDVTFANTAGRAMIATNKLLTMKANSLSATEPAADRALKDGLRAIENGDPLITARGVTIALSEAPDHRWIAHVLPLVDGMRRRTGKSHDAVAAVFVRNSLFATPTPLETLANLYKLTASEIRVVDAIIRVSGIDAIAEVLGILPSTVKTHLNHIFRKCGAKSQIGLIKLIAGIGR